MTSIDLVVTDLDGTLWGPDAALHPRTLSAIGTLAANGIPVLVATGRRFRSARNGLANVGLAPPAVLLNGALGIDLGSGQRFHRGAFSTADAVLVLERFVACGVEPCVYVDEELAPVRVGQAPSTHPDHLASFAGELAVEVLDDVVASEAVLAFSILGLAEETAVAVGAAIGDTATSHVDVDRVYGGWCLTVAPTAQSKWDGVAAFCATAGLDPERVLAIGDGANDLELLEGASIAVTPSDAHPDALARADHVVGTAHEGGWADILDLI